MNTEFSHRFLVISKLTGLFKLSRWLTRGALRIVCYHNFAKRNQSVDIYNWDPWLTVYVDTFEKRLKYLRREGYAVLGLDNAVKQLFSRQQKKATVVITIDDGWQSIKAYAHDVLFRYDLPYTIYLSSFYSENQVPVFNIFISYAFWKTTSVSIDLSELGVTGYSKFDLSHSGSKKQAAQIVRAFGEQKLDIESRQSLAKNLGDVLDVSYDRFEQSRVLHFLSGEEVSELAQKGVDFQLHTHRHRWPEDRTAALKEIDDNKNFLQPLVMNSLRHFCYPNGVWSREQLSFLREKNIESATGCDNGLNYITTNPLTLKRFLDSEMYSQLEFEGEISGYLDIVRRISKKFGRKTSGA
jgi:peptidoglycan/xylan/chitin deacetylase (PgdA/CDA1 family)